MVFIDDGSLSQTILCAENQETAEISGKKLVNGLFHLLASYYVYGVAYPKGCTALLYFMQDILDTVAIFRLALSCRRSARPSMSVIS